MKDVIFLTHLTRVENDVRSLMNFPLKTENKKIVGKFPKCVWRKRKKERFQMYL